MFKQIVSNLNPPTRRSELMTLRREQVLYQIQSIISTSTTIATTEERESKTISNDLNHKMIQQNNLLTHVGKSLEMLGECMKSCTGEGTTGTTGTNGTIKSHGNAGQGLMTRVRLVVVRGRKIIKKTRNKQTKGKGGKGGKKAKIKKEFQLSFHSKMSLATIKIQIKQYLESIQVIDATSHPIEVYKTKDWSHTNSLDSNDSILSDLYITDGTTLYIVAKRKLPNNRESKMSRDHEKKEEELVESMFSHYVDATPWDTLVEDDRYDLLFELFDYIPKDRKDIRTIIWNFLQSMPTQTSLLDVLYEPHRLSTISFQTWFGNNTEEDHLGEDNGEKNGTDTTMEVNREKSKYVKAVYVLQILDAMLMPSDALENNNQFSSKHRFQRERSASNVSNVSNASNASNASTNSLDPGNPQSFSLNDGYNGSSSNLQDRARIWRKNFLQCDGFQSILNFLLHHTKKEMKGDKGGMGIVLRTGISLALRLSKFFLVGMLHQKGIDVNDDRYSLLPNLTPPVPFKATNATTQWSSSADSDTDTDTTTDEVIIEDITQGQGETKTSDTTNQDLINNNATTTTRRSPSHIKTTTNLHPVSPATSVNSAHNSVNGGNSPNMTSNSRAPLLLRSFSIDSAEDVSESLNIHRLLKKLLDIVYSQQNIIITTTSNQQGKETTTSSGIGGIGGIGGGGERSEMLVTCFVLLEGLLRMKSEYIEEVLFNRTGSGRSSGSSNDDGNGYGSSITLTDVLLHEPDQRVRRRLFELLWFVSTFNSSQYISLITSLMKSTIQSISILNTTVTCVDFFQFARKILKHNNDSIYTLSITSMIMDMLIQSEETILYDGSRTVYENDLSQSVLQGLFDILSDGVNKYPKEHIQLLTQKNNGDETKTNGNLSNAGNADLIEILMHSYLFKIASQSDPSESLCYTMHSRRSCFTFLIALGRADLNTMNSQLILEKIFVLIKEFDDTVQHWDKGITRMQIDVEGYKKNSCGYVGLVNQGNTCYLNATVQQIFMITSLRRGLLSFKPKPKNETTENISNTTTTTTTTTAATATAATGSTNETKEEDKMSTMRELQRSLAYLSEGTFAGHNPKALVDSCSNLRLNENVYDQNCAAEFAMKLLDRLEENTKNTTHERLIKFHFSGSVKNQIFRYSDETTTVPLDCQISTQNEAFQIFPLAFHNFMTGVTHGSITEALDAWSAGERMEGTQQLECDFLPKDEETGKHPKVNGMKRSCLGTLPNTLIFHLQRVGLDLQTFESCKVNAKCTFPEILDMKKYTEKYLNTQDRKTKNTNKEKEGTREETQVGETQVGETKMGETNMGETKTGMERKEEEDEEDCTYRLRGVVIHYGVAGGGHYWSLARNEKGNWMKFNDIDVTSFNFKQGLAEEAYGGTYIRKTRDTKTNAIVEENVEREQSAYMLYYERIEPTVPVEEVIEKEIPKEKTNETKATVEVNQEVLLSQPTATAAVSVQSSVVEPIEPIEALQLTVPKKEKEEEEEETSQMLERIMRGLQVVSTTTPPTTTTPSRNSSSSISSTSVVSSASMLNQHSLLSSDTSSLYGLREHCTEVWQENQLIQRKRYVYTSIYFEFLFSIGSLIANDRNNSAVPSTIDTTTTSTASKTQTTGRKATTPKRRTVTIPRNTPPRIDTTETTETTGTTGTTGTTPPSTPNTPMRSPARTPTRRSSRSNSNSVMSPMPKHVTLHSSMAMFLYTTYVERVIRTLNINLVQLDQYVNTLLLLFQTNIPLCRNIIHTILKSSSKHSSKSNLKSKQWLTKRIFSKKKLIRFSISKLYANLLMYLSYHSPMDCKDTIIVVTQTATQRKQQNNAAMEALQNNSDDAGEIKMNGEVDENGRPTGVKLPKTVKVKKRKVGLVGLFFKYLEKMQVDAMENYLNYDAYLDIYRRLCSNAIDVPLKEYIYHHNILSTLIHLYLGDWSQNTSLSKLPSWNTIESKSVYTNNADKTIILNIITYLLQHVDPLKGMTNISFNSMQDGNFIESILQYHPSHALPLLAMCIQQNGITSMTAMRLLVDECSKTSYGTYNTTTSSSTSSSTMSTTLKMKKMKKFNVLIQNLICMLNVQDEFTDVRLRMLMLGDDKDLNGLIAYAEHYIKKAQDNSFSTNKVYAMKAYGVIKIISSLDTHLPSMHCWLEKNRTKWIQLVKWLDVESYEPSLHGNRYDLLRQKSAEETITTLASTGKVRLQPQERKVLGSPVNDSDGNVRMGWQGISTSK